MRNDKRVLSIVLGIAWWIPFYMIRLKEGNFGNASTVAFIAAILMPDPTTTFILWVAKKIRPLSAR